MSTLDDLNTLDATAAYLKIEPTVLAELARSRRIASVRIGRTRVFTREAIAAFVAAHTEPAIEPENPWGRARRGSRRSIKDDPDP